MNRRSSRRLWLGLAAVALACMPKAWGQPPPDVQVAVSTPRASTLLCEPASLDVTITNLDEREIHFTPFYVTSRSGEVDARRAYEATPLADGTLGALIRSPGSGDFRPYTPLEHIDIQSEPTDTLRQGESRYVPATILCEADNRESFVLARPGTYLVRISFRFQYLQEGVSVSRTAVSDALELVVLETTGREEEALEHWRRGCRGLPLRSCGRSAAGEEASRQRRGTKPGTEERYVPFDTLRERYADTIYGQYCQYFATDLHRVAERMPSSASLDELLAARAQGIERVLAGAPDFPLADRAQLDLAQYKLGLSESTDANGKVTRDEAKAAEARAILQELVQSGRKTVATEIARQRLERMSGQ